MTRRPRVLQMLGMRRGEAKGEQLAHGAWDVNHGMMFVEDWQADHLVREDDIALLALGFPSGRDR